MTERRLFVSLLFFMLMAVAACREAGLPPEETPDEPTATQELAEATAAAAASSTPAPAATTPSTPTTAPTATTRPPAATAAAPTATTAPAASATVSSPQPTATSCGPPAGWVEYTIRQGDTLNLLAQASGATVAEIQLANCLADTTLFTGSRLFLPVLPATPTPSVTPLPPPPIVLNGSQPQGSAPVEGQLTYDDAYLLRIDARRTGGPEESGWGIDRVEFRVSSGTVDGLYVHTEENPGYCIFGGGEPTCNPWPQVEGVYRWGAGGPPVEPGQYFVLATFFFTPESDDGSGIAEGSWSFSFDVAEP